MKAITGVDLPAGSPGGSVELLKDLYLGPAAPVPADAFMLAGPAEHGQVTLDVGGKTLDGPGFWAYVEELAAAIRDRFRPSDYGVVHLQHLAFGATPALLRAFPAHPALALVHGTDLLFAAGHPTQREVLAQAVAAAGAVVVPTSAMADLLPVRPRRTVHIPWGVPDHLIAAPPARARDGDGPLRVLYAGRLTPEKGVEALLDAVSGLDGVTLSLAAPEAEHRELAGRADLSETRYLGWLTRPELWRAFAGHDVLVVPSVRLEAFGLVAVEAQACGLPVLHGRVPGLAEVLGDSSLPVEPGSGALPDTLAWLAKDRGALADLRAAGRRNAARFPLSRTAAGLRDLSAQLQR
ncbi:glycosyltransferase family 4 protein [Nonomuraea endophytica]|uniref:Glycosyltransferase involved in cell wall biosynthesis n=1 Tax=Nonomuraea endophytica TaxID=714136 RepID=A0A7W8A4L9_9ACTN|nr:glycosyltransferase family 4 protein [Nonomuraea endophytica]MBB5078755.1 glycosyltransferase involved in cell wall biosynthesis [Nonomuraea endophytica]